MWKGAEWAAFVQTDPGWACWDYCWLGINGNQWFVCSSETSQVHPSTPSPISLRHFFTTSLEAIILPTTEDAPSGWAFLPFIPGNFQTLVYFRIMEYLKMLGNVWKWKNAWKARFLASLDSDPALLEWIQGLWIFSKLPHAFWYTWYKKHISFVFGHGIVATF